MRKKTSITRKRHGKTKQEIHLCGHKNVKDIFI